MDDSLYIQSICTIKGNKKKECMCIQQQKKNSKRESERNVINSKCSTIDLKISSNKLNDVTSENCVYKSTLLN